MNALDYTYPIFRDTDEGVDFIGNGFFVDDLFLTADHVLNSDDIISGSEPYIFVNGNKYLLQNKVKMCFKKITWDNGQMYGHEDIESADIAAFTFNNLKISSPLIFSDTPPKYGESLHCDFYHTLTDENNKEQKGVLINSKSLYLWETVGLVLGEEGFCGNFFGAAMTPNHPRGGSSGSPICDGNIVYGILHSGGEDLCGFYSSVHAHKLLCQYLPKHP